MSRRKWFFPFLVAVLGVPAALPLRAQPTPPDPGPLLKPPEREREGSVPLERSPKLIRQQKVTVDWNTLRGPSNQSVRLPIFDRQIVLLREREDRRTPRKFLWLGAVEGQPGSRVVLANVNKPLAGGEALAGDIMTVSPRGERDYYQIRYLGRGVHVLREVDPARFPPEARPDRVRTPQPTGEQERETCRDPANEIDVLVVYTDAARRAAGGRNGILASIENAVASANESYEDSGADLHLRLVHVKRVAYEESGVSKRDRDRLQSPADGHLDEVQPLRDSHAADAVVLFVNTLDDCGRSNLMAEVSSSFESRAYAVVDLECASSPSFSFAHELGHVMGARHDRQDDPTEGEPFDFNHGFVQKSPSRGEPWRTIMAKEPDPNCGEPGASHCAPRIAQWSNPGVSYPDAATGGPTGTADTDNHRTLNATAKTVSRFRCANPVE